MASSRLQQLAEAGALGHAYILTGTDERLLLQHAQSLAHFLEKGVWQQSAAPLSDALHIDGVTTALGIDEVRELSDFLYKTPQVSMRRLVIISHAGDLTPQAQNALLKIAEEPPTAGLLILITTSLGSLLPTLLSRFQSIYEGAVATGEPDSQTRKAQELVKEFLAAGAKQRSDLIKQMAKDEQEVEKADKIIDTFVTVLIAELAKDTQKNWRALKHTLSVYAAMQQYSVNKKLQLESLLPFIS
jgi:DNA polymerase III delta prime subunit